MSVTHVVQTPPENTLCFLVILHARFTRFPNDGLVCVLTVFLVFSTVRDTLRFSLSKEFLDLLDLVIYLYTIYINKCQQEILDQLVQQA